MNHPSKLHPGRSLQTAFANGGAACREVSSTLRRRFESSLLREQCSALVKDARRRRPLVVGEFQEPFLPRGRTAYRDDLLALPLGRRGFRAGLGSLLGHEDTWFQQRTPFPLGAVFQTAHPTE